MRDLSAFFEGARMARSSYTFAAIRLSGALNRLGLALDRAVGERWLIALAALVALAVIFAPWADQ